MRPPNVLISCAGRRVSLVRIAQSVVKEYGGQVVATDATPELSAACHVADKAEQVPSLESPDYIARLWDVIEKHHVSVVIPTIDTELPLLAPLRSQWSGRGVHVSISDPELIQECQDKRKTLERFSHLGIACPRVIHDDSTFPRFIKPVRGSLSKDIHLVENWEGFDPKWADRAEYLHQRVVAATVYDEYTVDMFYSRTGDLVSLVPRRRIEVRGGEISKGRTEREPLVDYLKPRFKRLSGARGCITAQFFAAKEWSTSEEPVLGIEINPRFGGGYPLSDHAGATYVKWLVEESCFDREPVATDDWRSEVTMLRYDDAVFIG